MKVLITGLKGTVGTAMKNLLESKGVSVIGWDRGAVPIDNYHAMEDFVRASMADAVVHLAIFSKSTGRPNESWLVNYEWTSELAWICRVLNIPFLFTSSVMVFSGRAAGPFTLGSVPDAAEGYGYEKRMAEERVFYQNPAAKVVRLGWQIGSAPGSNNMVDFLEKQMAQNGFISAGQKWLPACSFLEDTAAALWEILTQMKPGLYLADSNRGLSFYDIARALGKYLGRNWKVRPDAGFIQDQRMIDGRVPIPSLTDRLQKLVL